jgi:hypothetical protein
MKEVKNKQKESIDAHRRGEAGQTITMDMIE